MYKPRRPKIPNRTLNRSRSSDYRFVYISYHIIYIYIYAPNARGRYCLSIPTAVVSMKPCLRLCLYGMFSYRSRRDDSNADQPPPITLFSTGVFPPPATCGGKISTFEAPRCRWYDWCLVRPTNVCVFVFLGFVCVFLSELFWTPAYRATAVCIQHIIRSLHLLVHTHQAGLHRGKVTTDVLRVFSTFVHLQSSVLACLDFYESR